MWWAMTGVQGWIKVSLSLGTPLAWSRDEESCLRNAHSCPSTASSYHWWPKFMGRVGIPQGKKLPGTVMYQWGPLWTQSISGCGGSPFPPADCAPPSCIPCSQLLPRQVTLSHTIKSTRHLLTLWGVMAASLSGLTSWGPSQDGLQLLNVILRHQNHVSSAFNAPGWT